MKTEHIELLRCAELERERMRLAACGVVAQANTPETAAEARKMHDDYRSASCDAVAAAVDREMCLRAENARLWEALTKISNLTSEEFIFQPSLPCRIARAALQESKP